MPILPSPVRPADLLGGVQASGAPRAPTIADLLAKRPVQQITTQQDAANQTILDQLANADFTPSADRAENFNRAASGLVNFFANRSSIKQAEERDQAATDQASQRRSRIAEMLGGVGGLSREQAVGMASGDRDDNALFLSIMGAKRQQEAAEQARVEREQAATVDAARRQEDIAHRNRTFNADRDDAAANRALTERKLSLAGRPKEPTNVQALRAMGIDPRSPEGQQIIRDSLTGAAEGVNATRVGKIPAGMVAIPDQTAEAGYRIVPIEGSPEQMERELQDEKRLNKQEASKQDLTSITRDINRVLDMSREGAGGPIGGQVGEAPLIGPMTSAGQMAKHLDSIKANVAFGALQEMRNNSPTGGAVGQLSDDERKALSSTVGSLDLTLPEVDLQRNLIDYGVKRITTVHGTDAQIDAAVQSGKITQQQADDGRTLRDQQIAEFRIGGDGTPEQPTEAIVEPVDLDAASAEFGVPSQTILDAAQEAGVDPAAVIERLRAKRGG